MAWINKHGSENTRTQKNHRIGITEKRQILPVYLLDSFFYQFVNNFSALLLLEINVLYI